jgi:hypothetical protein
MGYHDITKVAVIYPAAFRSCEHVNNTALMVARAGSRGCLTSDTPRTGASVLAVDYIATDSNCCKKLSVSAGGVANKLRRLFRMRAMMLLATDVEP